MDGDTTIDVDKHLELGKKLLAAGQLTEALSHYHAAVGKIIHCFSFSHLCPFQKANVINVAENN